MQDVGRIVDLTIETDAKTRAEIKHNRYDQAKLPGFLIIFYIEARTA